MTYLVPYPQVGSEIPTLRWVVTHYPLTLLGWWLTYPRGWHTYPQPLTQTFIPWWWFTSPGVTYLTLHTRGKLNYSPTPWGVDLPTPYGWLTYVERYLPTPTSISYMLKKFWLRNGYPGTRRVNCSVSRMDKKNLMLNYGLNDLTLASSRVNDLNPKVIAESLELRTTITWIFTNFLPFCAYFK